MADTRKKKKLPALNINAKAKSADPERDSFGINSPKTQVLADPAEDTPADNKLRSVVNSPKAGEDTDAGMSFQNAQPQQNDALASLVTQVERPDASAKQTTTSKGETKPKRKPKKKSGWCCGCFSPSGDPLDDLEDGPNKAVELENSGGGKSTKPVQQTSGTNTQGESQEDIRREENGLLGRRKPKDRDKKCLVIDLDETLVHSSFKAVDKCDFIVPVEIENVVHNVYVLVRPYANEFLVEAAKHYEIVLFTASLAKYADPLLDLLDKEHTIDARLFRDSCVQIGYSYVKDLSRLGRKMSEVMIIDNSPQSYRFQPCNAIPITSWFDDPNDTELKDLIPVLKTTLKTIPDCRDILDAHKSYAWLCNQAT